MASLCEKLINQCIGADCNKPLFSGVDGVAYIANFADIASVTYDEQNHSIITGITMKTDTVGSDQVARCFYTVQQLGKNPFEGSQTELVEGTYSNKFTNTVQLAVADNSAEITNNVIDQMANGRFVLITVNDYRNDNSDNKYQIFGIQKGLRCTAMTREWYGDNDGAYILTLTEENVPKSGLFIYTTSESATDTMVNGLLCSCSD